MCERASERGCACASERERAHASESESESERERERMRVRVRASEREISQILLRLPEFYVYIGEHAFTSREGRQFLDLE